MVLEFVELAGCVVSWYLPRSFWPTFLSSGPIMKLLTLRLCCLQLSIDALFTSCWCFFRRSISLFVLVSACFFSWATSTPRFSGGSMRLFRGLAFLDLLYVVPLSTPTSACRPAITLSAAPFFGVAEVCGASSTPLSCEPCLPSSLLPAFCLDFEECFGTRFSSERLGWCYRSIYWPSGFSLRACCFSLS